MEPKQNQMTTVSRRSLDLNRQDYEAINVPRSYRGALVETFTSAPAGRITPVFATMLFREDQIRRGRVRVNLEMHETAEILMNPVNVNVSAWFVPYTAFDRFEGMDDLNRSYAKAEGNTIDFFHTELMGAAPSEDGVLEKLGHSVPAGNTINTQYIEAYNVIVNFMGKNRTPSFSQRTNFDRTLAAAFWDHRKWRHVVSDVDFEAIDGEVALNVTNAKMPITGIGKVTQTWSPVTQTVHETGASSSTTYTKARQIRDDTANGEFWIEEDPDNLGFPGVFAELQDNGITVSLANIDMARQTRAWAKMLERYNGINDQYLVDLLIQGISVPEQQWRQPMLLSRKKTIFGMAKRHASDGPNLTQSVVNGATYVDMDINLMRQNTGGVVMIVADYTPDQIWERMEDPGLTITDTEDLPNAQLDSLDPEKVEVVKNSYVDVQHGTPDGQFGLAPMNHWVNFQQTRIGGRYRRPDVDATVDEDRMRFWTAEVADPSLNADFYQASELHTRPFADTVNDPVDIQCNGQLIIEGNTVVGPALIEASNNYRDTLEAVDQTRIEDAS